MHILLFFIVMVALFDVHEVMHRWQVKSEVIAVTDKAKTLTRLRFQEIILGSVIRCCLQVRW